MIFAGASSAPRLPPDGYSGHLHDFDSATRFEQLKEWRGVQVEHHHRNPAGLLGGSIHAQQGKETPGPETLLLQRSFVIPRRQMNWNFFLDVRLLLANVTPENKLVGCFFAYLKSNNLDSGMSC